MKTHILHDGKLLCGTDPDHVLHHVPPVLRHEANCPACLNASPPELDGDMRARELIQRAERGEGRHDIKLVVDYLRRQPTTLEAQKGQPPKLGEAKTAALSGLFAAEGRTLMQLLFAWRAQGSLTRWSTGPSKALALFVDFLQREYPTGSAAARTRDIDFEEREVEP